MYQHVYNSTMVYNKAHRRERHSLSSIPGNVKVQNDIKIILAVNNYKYMEPKSRCDKSFPGIRRSLW